MGGSFLNEAPCLVSDPGEGADPDTPLTPLATSGQINLRTSLGFSTPTGYWGAAVTLVKHIPVLRVWFLSAKGPLLKWTFLN